jgi:hypothetical protein
VFTYPHTVPMHVLNPTDDPHMWGILLQCCAVLLNTMKMSTISRREKGRPMSDVEFTDKKELALHFAPLLRDCVGSTTDVSVFSATFWSGPILLPINVGASGASGLSSERKNNGLGYTKANTILLTRGLNGSRQFIGDGMLSLLLRAQKPIVNNIAEATKILSEFVYGDSPFFKKIIRSMRKSQSSRGMETVSITEMDLIGVAARTGLRCRISNVPLSFEPTEDMNQASPNREDENVGYNHLDTLFFVAVVFNTSSNGLVGCPQLSPGYFNGCHREVNDTLIGESTDSDIAFFTQAFHHLMLTHVEKFTAEELADMISNQVNDRGTVEPLSDVMERSLYGGVAVNSRSFLYSLESHVELRKMVCDRNHLVKVYFEEKKPPRIIDPAQFASPDNPLVKAILAKLKGLTKMFANSTIFPGTPETFSQTFKHQARSYVQLRKTVYSISAPGSVLRLYFEGKDNFDKFQLSSDEYAVDNEEDPEEKGDNNENASTESILVKAILAKLKGLTKMFATSTIFPGTPTSFVRNFKGEASRYVQLRKEVYSKSAPGSLLRQYFEGKDNFDEFELSDTKVAFSMKRKAVEVSSAGEDNHVVKKQRKILTTLLPAAMPAPVDSAPSTLYLAMPAPVDSAPFHLVAPVPAVGTKPFHCRKNSCNKDFATIESLQRHIVKYHPSLQLECPHGCDQVFRHQTSLDSHLAAYHQ